MRILRDRGKILASVAICTLLLLGFGSLQAYAQNEPDRYSNVRLWIYPEYDDPRLLVMLEGQIEGTKPPTEVKFLVPSTAEMYSAGSMDAQGNYSGGPPDRKPSPIPSWDEISYQVTTDTFRVEYYDPIIFSNPKKTFSYTFRTAYPMSDIEIVFQEPIGATDFMISPTGEKFVDIAGFHSYLYRYTDLEPEATIQFDISYTRTLSTPSLFSSEEAFSPSQSASGESENSNNLWIMIALGAVILCIVAVFAWRRRTAPVSRAERRRTTRTGGKPEQQSSTPVPKFCSQCGNPVDSTHKFCPSCGIKVR